MRDRGNGLAGAEIARIVSFDEVASWIFRFMIEQRRAGVLRNG